MALVTRQTQHLGYLVGCRGAGEEAGLSAAKPAFVNNQQVKRNQADDLPVLCAHFRVFISPIKCRLTSNSFLQKSYDVAASTANPILQTYRPAFCRARFIER